MTVRAGVCACVCVLLGESARSRHAVTASRLLKLNTNLLLSKNSSTDESCAYNDMFQLNFNF